MQIILRHLFREYINTKALYNLLWDITKVGTKGGITKDKVDKGVIWCVYMEAQKGKFWSLSNFGSGWLGWGSSPSRLPLLPYESHRHSQIPPSYCVLFVSSQVSLDPLRISCFISFLGFYASCHFCLLIGVLFFPCGLRSVICVDKIPFYHFMRPLKEILIFFSFVAVAVFDLLRTTNGFFLNLWILFFTVAGPKYHGFEAYLEGAQGLAERSTDILQCRFL